MAWRTSVTIAVLEHDACDFEANPGSKQDNAPDHLWCQPHQAGAGDDYHTPGRTLRATMKCTIRNLTPVPALPTPGNWPVL
jgi:hypothetical protein